MSQITRCPSCATTFRVVPDQLRISEGWVRCGQCKEVFDAGANMLVASVPSPATGLREPEVTAALHKTEEASGAVPFVAQQPRSQAVAQPLGPGHGTWVASSWPEEALEPAFQTLNVPQPEIPSFLARGSSSGAHEAQTGMSLSVDAGLPPAATAINAAEIAKAWPPAVPGDGVAQAAPALEPAPLPQVPPELDSLTQQMDDSKSTAAQPGVSVHLQFPRKVDHARSRSSADSLPEVGFPLVVPAEPEVVADPVAAASQQHAQTQPMHDAAGESAQAADAGEDAMPEVGFVRDAQRAAFWRRPLVRSALALLVLVLFMGLLGQVAVHERYHLVAADARLRPLLVALCEPIGCSWSPPRQISEVVIESSAFNKARGDSYMLALTLKNRSAMALEMPAVELTLTDAQDQAIVRKILLPADLGADVALAARQEWSGNVPVVVTTGGGRVAGYRLLAFYP